MFQLGLIGGGHHNHTRQIGHIADVKRPRMGRAIRPDKPGAINGETHGQALNGHIMHNLIIAPLQKRRIHRTERAHPARSQSGSKGHTMLFGNAHIETARGIAFGHQVQPRAIGHGGGHGTDPAVLGGQPHQFLPKDRGIRGRV